MTPRETENNSGWYCVTKGNISFLSLLLCFRSADSLSVNFISDRRFSIIVCGQPLSINHFLKFEIFSSNVVFEEFVRRILKASPLTNPFLRLGR